MVCRICQGELRSILDLGDQFIATHLRPLPEGSIQFPLKLCQCVKCGVVQLSYTVPPDKMFKHYWYRTAVNPQMVEDLRAITERARVLTQLQPGDTVVDIGCNDWSLLRTYPHDVIRIGVDPSDIATEILPDGCTLIRDYFPPAEGLDVKAKVITAIAMFYDVAHPRFFLQHAKKMLDDGGMLVLQLSHLKSMVEQTAFDNICHEHLFYYSFADIKRLCEEEDLMVFDVELNQVNGGSMQVWITHPGGAPTTNVDEVLEQEKLRYEDLPAFARRAKDRTNEFVRRLEGWKAKGKRVHALGASTKGQVFLQYAHIGPDLIQAVEERNPRKFGKQTITGIPIIPDMTMAPAIKVVLPWHFWDNIVNRERTFINNGGTVVRALPDFKMVFNNGEIDSCGHVSSLR
jgi:SAM-dependent methyltransferase